MPGGGEAETQGATNLRNAAGGAMHERSQFPVCVPTQNGKHPVVTTDGMKPQQERAGPQSGDRKPVPAEIGHDHGTSGHAGALAQEPFGLLPIEVMQDLGAGDDIHAGIRQGQVQGIAGHGIPAPSGGGSGQQQCPLDADGGGVDSLPASQAQGGRRNVREPGAEIEDGQWWRWYGWYGWYGWCVRPGIRCVGTAPFAQDRCDGEEDSTTTAEEPVGERHIPQ